jgi:hypothetical protein
VDRCDVFEMIEDDEPTLLISTIGIRNGQEKELMGKMNENP